MSLEPVGSQVGSGGSGIPSLGKVLKELQGLRVTLVTGAAAATKMNVAAMRKEDTILSAIVAVDAGGAMTNDVANITISSTQASGTITHSTGLPVDAETFVVNGVTYTFKTTPTAQNHVKIAATFQLTGDNTAATINAYENRRLGSGWNDPQVVAVSNGAGVVTITSIADGAGNGPVVTDTGSTITISNTDPAAVTATFAAAGNTDAVIVNGITFTIRTTPANADLDMPVLGSNPLQAAELARAVNAYENKYGTLDVVVTPAAAVATIAPRTARKGNIITLTEAATNVAVSGSGFLANGTATGGFTSTTNLASRTVTLTWFDKK